MTIQKYEGKTKEEAIEKARERLGDNVVIMNVKTVRPGGLFGVFQKGTVEVTVAIEDDVAAGRTLAAVPDPAPARKESPAVHVTPQSALEKLSRKGPDEVKNFTAVADETITIPPVGRDREPAEPAINTYKRPGSAISVEPQQPSVDADALRSVFKEVNEVISGASSIPVSAVADYDPSAKIIHADQIKSEPVPYRSEKNAPTSSKVLDFPEERLASQQSSADMKSGFVRMLYNKLVDNEVDERYVNSLLSDLGDVMSSDASVDRRISNVYQKMILQLGNMSTISLSGKPTVVFLIGPTGVGKTTTIAKLASRYKLKEGKSVAFITSDTYRIAAQEQLSTYAGILKAPISVLYEASDLPEMLKGFKDQDLVLVDTVGFSHMNTSQRDNLKALLAAIPEEYHKEIYLVLSATTKYNDLKAIVDAYKEFTDFSLVFTKLDETGYYGNIYNIRRYSDASLSYVTNGQNVPDDISVLDPQKLVKTLLGGR